MTVTTMDCCFAALRFLLVARLWVLFCCCIFLQIFIVDDGSDVEWLHQPLEEYLRIALPDKASCCSWPPHGSNRPEHPSLPSTCAHGITRDLHRLGVLHDVRFFLLLSLPCATGPCTASVTPAGARASAAEGRSRRNGRCIGVFGLPRRGHQRVRGDAMP